MNWDLEELARVTLEEVDVGVPVDPSQIAARLGLTVCHADGCDGVLIGDQIIVDHSIRAERRAFAIAHELGHYVQRRARLPDRESTADYLASALLLPRDDFERDLRRFGWDLIRLHARHRLASFEALARRIVALREARAFVFDRPLRTGRHGWYSVPSGHEPTDTELLAAAEAFECGAPVEVVTGITGWPVLEHHWHRAIVVAAA